MELNRCDWCLKSQLEMDYHDTEWGKPLFDDGKLFEFIVLDTFQAGLSWAIVLKKREGFRAAFDGFDYRQIARYNGEKLEELAQNPLIIRNKLKIEATVGNAQAFIKIREEFGNFGVYLWAFVGNEPIVNHWETQKSVPATSPQSDALSKDLSKRGFKFVGSTICYAFMQAAGLVNDHLIGCFRYEMVQKSKLMP